MLRSGCSASISWRRASSELGSFFFQPANLHLQAADLGVQLLCRGLINRWTTSAVLEQLGGPIEKLLPPATDLNWMHAELAGELAQRLPPLYRGQSRLRLQSWTWDHTLPCHVLSPSVSLPKVL